MTTGEANEIGAVLDLRAVTVELGRGDTRTTVLDRIDVTFSPGEVAALAGPSGSGKSTLLAVCGALLRPTSGQVLLGDEDLAPLGDAARARVRRERIGYVFQSGNLVSGLTALDQVLVPAYLAGRRPAAYRARAGELLDAVGMSHRSGHRGEQLSGGERRRVALARALLLSPALLLVDEPTAAVDRAQAGSLVDLMVSVTRESGCTCVVATHDPVVIEAADRTVRMEDLRDRARPAA